MTADFCIERLGPARRQNEAEQQPAMEIHIGETHTDQGQRARHAIIWLNGRRWEGDLHLQEAGT